MVIRSTKGERVVDAEDYFIGPAIDITRMTVLKPGELLTAIRIPATWAGAQFYFEKIRDRQVWDFPLVNIASAAVFTGGNIDRIRIAVNGVAAHPVRLKEVEDAVTGKPRNEETGEMAGQMAIAGRAAAALQRLQSSADAESGEARHPWRGGTDMGIIEWAQKSVGTGRPHSHRVLSDLGIGDRGLGVPDRPRHLGALFRQARRVCRQHSAAVRPRAAREESPGIRWPRACSTGSWPRPCSRC